MGSKILIKQVFYSGGLHISHIIAIFINN